MSPAPASRIHIDTDPGLDDLLALALAACEEEQAGRYAVQIEGSDGKQHELRVEVAATPAAWGA